MILYFTATGNSLAVARTLAEATGDGLFDMGKAYKEGNFEVTVEQGEQLGFVFPTYRWATPPLVDRFVERMSFVKPDGSAYAKGEFRPGYCFSVETYGHFPGTESTFFGRELAKYQGIERDAAFSVHSVGNCLYLFNTPPEGTVRRKLDVAERQCAHVVQRVTGRKRGDSVMPNPLGAALSAATGKPGKRRSTSMFYADPNTCVGCGTCARLCPTNSIAMVDGKPVWSGDECTECLACVQLCPHGAAQHGKATVGRRRYHNPVLDDMTRTGEAASASS